MPYDLLYVEDQSLQHRALGRLLDDGPVRLHPALDVARGFGLLEREFNWCGVLADYHLPDGTGMEVVTRARALWPSIPSLVVTADDGHEINHECALAGVGCIRKPFGSRLLEPFIAEVVDYGRAGLGVPLTRLALDIGATTKEEQILRLALVESMSRRQLADALGVSENTIKTHIRRLLAKANASCLEEFRARLARENHE